MARDRFAVKTSSRTAITITGRRVVISPFNAAQEPKILNALKSRQSTTIQQMISELCRAQVKVGEVGGELKDIDNWNASVLSAEEYDLLFLIQSLSYGNNLDFSHTCSACGDESQHRADGAKMRRMLIECGDESCPCHEVNELARETSDVDWRWPDFMASEWEKVPEDHLDRAPARLLYVPSEDEHLEPEPRAGYKGLVFALKHPKVSQKYALGDVANLDPKSVEKYLVEIIDHIKWPAEDPADEAIDTSVHLDARRKSENRKVVRRIKEMSLRLSIRDFFESQTGGLDSSIKLACRNASCGARVSFRVPVTEDFFFRRRSRA